MEWWEGRGLILCPLSPDPNPANVEIHSLHSGNIYPDLRRF